MAFEESLVMLSPSSSSPLLKEEEEEDVDGFHQIRNPLSRLSICCTSSLHDVSAAKNHHESAFDGEEADGEVSDEEEGGRRRKQTNSDQESPCFYSLPAKPSRRRRKLKDSGDLRKQRRGKKKSGSNGGGGEGLTVLTGAKGGETSLRMGLEQVKASCRYLGFELEVPSRISASTGSIVDTHHSHTSSGSNSPIATWRISSPGDDPKEVKARLKVWAQAVALASASRQAS